MVDFNPQDGDTIARVYAEFTDMQNWRALFAAQWEEVAALIMPTSRNTFFYGSFNYPGMKKTDRQVDATGMVALSRFAAICDSMITPKNSMYHGLKSPDPYVMKDRQTRLWFETVTRLLFQYRYMVGSNFASQNQAVWSSLGAFGNSGMLVEEHRDRTTHQTGLRYINVPMGELFFYQNNQNQVDGFVRWYKLTARQAAERFGYDMLPEKLRAALDQKSQWPYNFLWRVMPNTEWDPGAVGAKGKAYSSIHLCLDAQQIMRAPGGYRGLPLTVSRYYQAPGETYGRSVAMDVLPALKTLNAEKTVFLRSGHRAADPVLLTVDDMTTLNMVPGAINPGGITGDGKPKVGVVPMGNLQITKEMMDEERQLINDSFLVSLFQILTETPQMTATEVIERVNEKGILIAPTLGRQEDEYLGPMVTREIDVLSHLGKLPPMPPRLREAGGIYDIVFSSPLARTRRAGDAAGFMRMLQTTQEVVQVTGDVSLFHPFAFERAIPALAEIQGVPENWMASPDEVAQKGKQLQEAQQRQQQIQAAPAAAAMLKAQAAAGPGGAQPPGQQPPPAMAGAAPNAGGMQSAQMAPAVPGASVTP